ncbi:MAG TPA: efflux transporter outer membrane subunit [Verrucomicrobiae bacterium]|jgi:NodT family efflux transporter outer membrane factor (OMF) lipoprotein|nr:efflux transporter outer membrane subunit [Verrucomicrobiae bacterium]
MMKLHPLFLPTILAGILLGGCAVGPNFKPPQPDAPPSWVGLTNATTASGSVATAAPADLTDWWKKFNDPHLVSLINEGFRTNLDLKIAESVLRQARAERTVVAGALFPSLSGNGSYLRGVPNDVTASLDAAWELDIFGGTRRNVESATATVVAQQENLHDVRVTLSAEIALDYIQLRSYQEQIGIAKENLHSEERTAKLTQEKLAAGFASALDVANAEAEVATTEATIPVLETSARQTIYALSLLLARPPGDLVEELSKPGAVPLTPPEVPIGLPSDLVRRRPDIREAEAQLHAANAQIGVAEAQYFPQFSLTGTGGYSSDLARTLFAGSSRFWDVGPTMTWNIFQGGALTANVRVQRELTTQAFLSYRKTVLTALDEVENQLVAFANEWNHRQSLNEAVVQNRKAVDLSNQLYAQGTIDFLTVLDAERSLYASETALSQSKESISTDLVSLYKALGGGWQ